MLLISPTSCREQIPDPEYFAQCIRDSFQEYLALAQRPARRRGKRKAKAARGAKTKKAVKAKAATKRRAA
jgi:hypothetical protein